MAKRRTRKDKVEAKHNYSLPQVSTTGKKTSKQARSKKQAQTLSGLDPIIIARDLRKTLYVSLIIIVLECGLYFSGFFS